MGDSLKFALTYFAPIPARKYLQAMALLLLVALIAGQSASHGTPQGSFVAGYTSDYERITEYLFEGKETKHMWV